MDFWPYYLNEPEPVPEPEPEKEEPAGPDYTRIKTKESGGVTLRRCSHNIPFEDRCDQCVDEAIARENERNKGG